MVFFFLWPLSSKNCKADFALNFPLDFKIFFAIFSIKLLFRILFKICREVISIMIFFAIFSIKHFFRILFKICTEDISIMIFLPYFPLNFSLDFFLKFAKTLVLWSLPYFSLSTNVFFCFSALAIIQISRDSCNLNQLLYHLSLHFLFASSAAVTVVFMAAFFLFDWLRLDDYTAILTMTAAVNDIQCWCPTKSILFYLNAVIRKDNILNVPTKGVHNLPINSSLCSFVKCKHFNINK